MGNQANTPMTRRISRLKSSFVEAQKTKTQNEEQPGICQQEVHAFLKKKRAKHLNTISNQSYSFTQDFPEFHENNGGDSKMDLCVLGGKPTKPGMVSKKNCQDDAAVIKIGESYTLGVFDGHGFQGHHVSASCVAILEKLLEDDSFCLKFFSDPEKSMKNAISIFHEQVCSARDFDVDLSGTTATLALLVENKLHLSWVGDSKAILLVSTKENYSDLVAFNVTTEHNLKTKEEVERVKNNGGRVGGQGNIFGKGNIGPPRIWDPKVPMKPGLAMSKSVGDAMAHRLGCTDEADYFSLDIGSFKTMSELAAKIPENFNLPETQKTEEQSSNASTAGKLPRKEKSAKEGHSSEKNLLQKDSSFDIDDEDEDAEEDDTEVKITTEPLQSSSSISRLKKRTKSGENQKLKKQNSGNSLTSLLSLKGTKSKDGSSRNSRSRSKGKDKVKNSKSGVLYQTIQKGTGKISSMYRTKSNLNDPIKHCILVVASDGVWNAMTKDEVAAYFKLLLRKKQKDEKRKSKSRKENLDIKAEVKNISQRLCLEAQARWLKDLERISSITDDISAVTVVLY